MPYQFPSRRSVVMGFGGAVATSQPLAAQAGLRVLMQGGNAADAAVATAAALNVVEPMSTGVGGDMFALVYWAADRKVYALNGSGRAPYAATVEALRARGLRTIPERGILPVTVPGAAAGWGDLITRFGRLGLDKTLAPAIDYAEMGFPVSEIIAAGWRNNEKLLRQDEQASRTFLLNGHAPRAGERFQLPDLGRTLRTLAEGGADAFYNGQVARAIVAASDRLGGFLTMQDMADHTSTWVDPIKTDYRGYTVYECPPNGQGIAALMAMNTLRQFDVAAMGYESADAMHVKMESIKLALTDAARYVADPEMADVPIEGLLSESYAQQRRALIDMDRAIALPEAGLPPMNPDTVYLTVVDSEGNGVSFINSLYEGFGSGIVPEGAGFALQNRGHLFVMDPDHLNCIAPHKRPYHTIIPCMATKDDALALCFGVMGGFMQPQGHLQVLSNIADHGMDPQRALDAPRFCFLGENRFIIEESLPGSVYASLEKRGHQLTITDQGNYGGGQVIMVDPNSGALMAGSEPRNDGAAVAY